MRLFPRAAPRCPGELLMTRQAGNPPGAVWHQLGLGVSDSLTPARLTR